MRYFRRFIWFIAARLLILLILISVLSVTFYFAMNATNIYVIIKDGMARRAQVIMMDESPDGLARYFTQSWIERDELLQSTLSDNDPYRNASVKGFDHRIKMNYVWCWPWENTATATIEERIPSIDGKITGGGPVIWTNMQYTVVLARDSGNWKIQNMTPTGILND